MLPAAEVMIIYIQEYMYYGISDKRARRNLSGASFYTTTGRTINSSESFLYSKVSTHFAYLVSAIWAVLPQQ
jgi:hypothetical protein